MGIFADRSRRETKERAGFLVQNSGLAGDAIKDYKRGRIKSEDLRRELARHDDYFRYVDAKDIEKSL